MYDTIPRDAIGRFLDKKVAEAVEYALGLEEHKDYPSSLAREVALANGVGRELNDKQIEKFDEELGSY